MFGRLLWRLLEGSRGRLMVAFVAIVSGAAVISAMLSLQGDVEKKLGEQFRLLGANIIVSRGMEPQTTDTGSTIAGAFGSPPLMEQQKVLSLLAGHGGSQLVAAAPFLYVVAQVNGRPVVVAGTWFDQLSKLNPTWKIAGGTISARDNTSDCLIGRNAAEQFHFVHGSDVELQY